jgi:polysaccharide biosynthesis transport protein
MNTLHNAIAAVLKPLGEAPRGGNSEQGLRSLCEESLGSDMMSSHATSTESSAMMDHRERKSEPEGINLWSLMLHRKWLILFFVSVGLGLGYLHFNRQPPIYQSTGRLHMYVDQTRLPLEITRYPLHQRNLQNTHVQIIRSPEVVKRAVLESGLTELPSLQSGDAVGIILGNLHVSGVVDTDIISLTYRGPYPDDCESILSAVMQSYQKYLEEGQASKQTKLKLIIEEATGKLSEQIAGFERRLAEHRKQNSITLKGDVPYNPHQSRMEAIDVQRQKLGVERTKLHGQLTSVRQLESRGEDRRVLLQMLETFDQSRDEGEMDLPKTSNFLKPPSLIERYVELELLKDKLGDEHASVKKLKLEIDVREELYAANNPSYKEARDRGEKPEIERDVVAQYLSAIEHQIETIESMLSELDEEYKKQQEESYKIDDLIAEHRKLQNDVANSQQLIEVFKAQLNELNLIGESGGIRANTLQEPDRGTEVAVNFNQIMTTGAGLGLLLGMALAYLLESFDTSYKSPDDIAATLGTPVLGHIPAMDLRRAVINSQSKLDPSLCTFHETKSRVAESYRAVRTALYFSVRGEGHKLVQVTSPDPGDGKSTLALNLAISIANSGKRVLLIDADLRRPRVHRLLGLGSATGLTSVIAEEAKLTEAIQSTEVENLSALVCGPRPSNPSELLTSPRFPELLEHLRQQFDFVIVDTPPMLAVTDSSAVAARVDGVFLAIRLTAKARAKSIQAVKLLNELGANVMGVVVNGVGNRQDHAYGTSYSYGGRNQHYGYEDDEKYWYYYDDVDDDTAEDSRTFSRDLTG